MKMLITYILMFAGTGFILVAAVGVLRYRDTYSRMHATTKATSFGILLLLAGVCVYFSGLVVLVKALLIILFIYLTAPLAAHSIASACTGDKEDQYQDPDDASACTPKDEDGEGQEPEGEQEEEDVDEGVENK